MIDEGYTRNADSPVSADDHDYNDGSDPGTDGGSQRGGWGKCSFTKKFLEYTLFIAVLALFLITHLIPLCILYVLLLHLLHVHTGLYNACVKSVIPDKPKQSAQVNQEQHCQLILNVLFKGSLFIVKIQFRHVH